MYEYLIGSIILLATWFFIFVMRKDLRKEIIFSSILITPLGATDIFFIPFYWNPQTLFNFNPGIESFLFSFAVGGIASALYEFLFKKHLTRIRESKRMHHKQMIYFALAIIISLTISYFIFGKNYMPAMILAGFVGAITIAIMRRDLIKEILVGGLFFMIFYSLFTIILNNIIWPGIFGRVWNFSNLSGFSLLGVPIEEIIWSLATGMLIEPIYEYIKEYKIKK